MGYRYAVISGKTSNVLRRSKNKKLAEEFARQRNERRKKIAKAMRRKYVPVRIKKI